MLRTAGLGATAIALEERPGGSVSYGISGRTRLVTEAALDLGAVQTKAVFPSFSFPLAPGRESRQA